MRRFSLLLLALLLSAFTALAEDAPAYFNKGDDGTPVFSEDVLLMQTANAALYERYNLTAHCLGLFDVEVTHYGDAALVRYIPRSRPHPALSGEYAVLVTPDSVQAFWTHDDVDPAVWQSGELNSIAWGAPQLTAYLLESSFEREFFDEPYKPDEQEQWLTAEEINAQIKVFSTRLGTLTAEEAEAPSAQARAALQAMYNLSNEAAEEIRMVETILHSYADGRSEWSVSFYHDTEPDEINYFVRLNDQTILEISCFTGGIG